MLSEITAHQSSIPRAYKAPGFTTLTVQREVHQLFTNSKNLLVLNMRKTKKQQMFGPFLKDKQYLFSFRSNLGLSNLI